MRNLYRVVTLALWLVAGANMAYPAQAGLFTRILREAGDAGGTAASHSLSHLGSVGKAAAYLNGLKGAKLGALAAHATPEGHWQFVNREGQVFTAGTADEMQRVMKTLSPQSVAVGESRMTLYVSEDSVFQNRSALNALPADAELHVVTGGGAFPVERIERTIRLRAQLRPHIVMELIDRRLFDEAVSFLARSVNRSDVRTIGIARGGKTALPSALAFDPVTRFPVPDVLDPAAFDASFGRMRGRTAILIGEVADGRLVINTGDGEPLVRSLDALSQTARAHDVNLIVLHSDAGRQPGARNWLWQRMTVGGMEQAAKAVTQGDFVEALGAQRGGVMLSAVDDGAGRVHFTIRPEQANTVVGEATNYIGDAVGRVTGEIVGRAADVYTRDRAAESELNARLIPGVPTYIQYPYLVSLVAGVLAWATARGWWGKVWPRSAPAAQYGFFRRFLRAVPRESIYWLLFLPVVGLPAFIIHSLSQLWQAVTAPFRWLRRIFLRREI